MFTKSFATVVVALAASTLVSAQTHTDCDPRKKKCRDAPAFGGEEFIDFTKGNGDKYLHTLEGTTVKYDDELGAIFSISKDTEAPTKASDGFIFFGELECSVQAAPGNGIITSIVLQSDDLDEIDWEWVGGDNKQVQTNYFSKGDTTTYDRGAYHDVANPTGQFHTYGIVWTKEQIDWTIDGVSIRTLTYKDAKNGETYPQSPMQIKLGTWAPRKSAGEGTIEWAGGLADFENGGPYIGYYKNCKIVDYMGGEKGATAYSYPDGYDGKWESVIIKTDGDKDGDDKTTTTTTSTKPTTTPAKSAAASSSESSEASSATTLSSVVSSSASVEASSSAEATSTPSTTTAGDDEQASSTEGPSTVPSDESAASIMSKANLALGAAGLFAALML